MSDAAVQEIEDGIGDKKQKNSEDLENKRVWQEAQGDKTACEQLMRKHQGLVGMILRRFEGKGYERQELEQVGNIGLFKAIQRYDPNLGYAFSSYAVPVIIGEIKRHIRQDHLMHISRPIQENAVQLKKIREKYCHEKGREPSVEELARETGLSSEEILLAVEMSDRTVSLDCPVSGEGEGQKLGELLADKSDPVSELVEHMALYQVLDQLPQEDRTLIKLRYMEEKTQTQTARIMGKNQVFVSRREKKILADLRRRLTLETV